MGKYFYNIKYFLKETKTIIKLNFISNILTLFSIALILFILSMVISGWWLSNRVVEAIQEEAEVNAYFDENLDNDDVLQLVERIKGIEGVREARMVNQKEAYKRMTEILGEEARVLEYFDDNPFSSFIEVKIHLEKMDYVLEKISTFGGIEHVRDNRRTLDRLRSISQTLKILGYFVLIAIGITTLVIISHIIRLGIYNNKEQINTLRLLGAPEGFIAFPFVLEGLFLTLAGGGLAAALSALILKFLYGQMRGPLPFIPFPPLGTMAQHMGILIIFLSIILGFMGSLFGLLAAKEK